MIHSDYSTRKQAAAPAAPPTIPTVPYVHPIYRDDRDDDKTILRFLEARRLAKGAF